MLTLPDKFTLENNKPNRPAFILKLLQSELKHEETLKADWDAALSSNAVDTATVVGDVLLNNGMIIQASDNAEVRIGGSSVNYYHYQSFITPAGGMEVGKIMAKFHANGGGLGFVGGYSRATAIYTDNGSNAPGSLVSGSAKDNGGWGTIYQENYTWEETWNYGTSPVSLSGSTKYWIQFFCANASSYVTIYQRLQNTSVYSGGNFRENGTDRPTYDAWFSIFGYAPTGNISVKLDLGSTPTIKGEWRLDYLIPGTSALTFQAWSSATGAFGGEETNLGTITDGTEITDLKRYYKVTPSFTNSTNALETPALKSIMARFPTFIAVSDRPAWGYESAIKNIPAITTSIDTFRESTIGQLSPSLSFTKQISNWLATSYPKNKEARIYMGYEAPGFAETDFIDYYRGVVQDWNIGTDDTVSLILQDYSRPWKGVPIPSKWQTTGDDKTWTSMHPVDVMLDIMLGHIGVTVNSIESSSFDDVKAATPGWTVTRTLTGKTYDCKDLLEELRLLLSAFFIPQANGKIRLKRWDPAASSVASLTDSEMNKVAYKGNAASLINRVYDYYNINDDGSGRGGTISLDVNYDSTSQANWGEIKTKEILDKWTLTAQGSQPTDLTTGIIARYKNIPNGFEFELDRRFIFLETGDPINITTKRAPSTDMLGISNVKYQIVNRNLDPKNDTIKITALRAA